MIDMMDMINKIALVRGLFEGYGPSLASKLYFTVCGKFGTFWGKIRRGPCEDGFEDIVNNIKRKPN